MKRWIHANSNTGYRVDIVFPNGDKEYFDTFVNEDYAHYNIALALSTPNSVYRTRKYQDADWVITEEVV